MTSLAQHLSVQGMTVKSTGLEGRYHSIIHEGAFTKILGLCSSRHDLEFPAADKLIVPVRSNASSQTITEGLLHQHALRDIMIDLANWHLTISAAVSPLIQMKGPLVMSFGLVDSIPSSIVRESGLKVSKFKSSKLFPSRLVDSEFSKSFGTSSSPLSAHEDCRYPDHAIAVIGMACKFPGADNLDEFWQLLTSGTSMLQQMPAERFPTEGLRRSQDGKLRFWGNFVRDIDVFDHRFFKKSSREAATMDPQQRLLLQVAYEAMESSGYFGNLSASTPNDIGCYLGVCANDYNDNVASHPPNAFSSLGTLRAFLSGKISHYFGWKGPSVTYDTACSSSAVAIHSACKAIESGECSQAVAGGVSLYTSPNFYQNLAAASFLSPTGATKPFDANADGYCRGEGVGLVVLKKLSAALTDGDTVLGVITGSAVNQNSNSTPITVPHSPSQVELYQKVCFLSCIDPLNVSFVEAHGTGTPVGDPIEFESIRQVFGSVNRTKSLHVASVKGNIGHLEGASGVAALIKTLLMMQNKTIPVQASFSSLNPKIPALEPDRMAIPLYTQQWDTDRQVACINNYGAAGSNAAMIVCQPPGAASRSCDTGSQILSLSKYPIFISANSTASLVAYCKTLQTLIQSSSAQKNLLSTLAFNLADKQNRSLSHVFATTVSQPIDLSNQLAAVTSGTLQPQVNTKAKPVVLVFGGQVSNAIGLNKNLYDTSILLRSHLDHCDSVLRSIGLSGLYPEVFQTEPVKDIVKLHCALFSVQYSCSKSWVDSGLQISALVGHSFGQLTTLCISGTLSLEDGLKLVSGRASLMQTHWSSERGSMISIEADMNTVLNLISSVNTSSSDYKVEIACYNGPTSHVLVGTNSSIEALEDELSQGSIKFKRLNVTHGFHSAFTEPLLPALAKLAEELVYNEPVIPLETCTNDQSCAQIGPQMIADHTRMPVYFGQAIGRLANRLGPCTWLEAGSGSSVTGMVRRSLDTSIVSSHLFQSIQLNTASAVGFLADATTNLWSCGHKFQFWLFHRCQKHEYPAINLPPYQFEKSRHWLPWVDTAQTPLPVESTKLETDHMLLSFVRFRDQGQREAEFCVDPRSKEYRLYVLGHAVLAEPLCPAPLYVELVSQAAMVLKSEAGQSDYLPCVEELEIKAPLGMNVDRAVTIKMTRIDKELPAWTFELTSQLHGNGGKGSPSSHATGRITLHLESPKMVMDFARYEVLIGYKRFDDLKFDPESEIIQGAMVYKSFAKVVQYADYYKGVKSVYARNREVAGNVILPDHDQSALRHTVTKPLAIDNFIQVAGLHVNTLSECGDNEVYVCTKVHHIQAGPKFESSGSWIVYSNFTPSGEREVVNDIFVFDTKTKSLVLIVLGARFMKVLVSSLTKVLSRANTSNQLETSRATSNTPIMPVQVIPDKNPVLLAATSFIGDNARPSHKEIAATDLDADIRKLLHRVTDVPVDAFNDDSTLEELGIDSLMITEVMSEICKFFEFDISATDFQTLLDIKSLRAYLLARGCGSRDVPAISFSRSDSSADSFSSTPAITAATSVENLPAMNDNVFSELAKLITTHLETETTMSRGTNLANEGLDSLLSIELANDIQKIFGVVVDMSLLDGESTFGNLLDMITPQQMLAVPPANVKVLPQLPAVSPMPVLPKSSLSVSTTDHPAALGHAQQAFETIRYDYDVFTKQTGFEGFWKQVYPAQSRLVLAYTVEAFATLGCALASLRPGQRLPQVQFLPKHTLLVNQLQNILTDASLVTSDATHLVRSDTQIDCTPSTTMYQQILQASPHHASEHKLLHITGSKLAKCLTGAADPLQLLFRSKENKQLLEDVYSNGPMYEAINKLLHSFLSKAYAKSIEGGTFHILELGGGTGGTTKYIVDALARENVSFTYTFTDISGSLVTAAKKKFAGRDFLDFLTLDIEKAPPERFLNKFHTIISTNCIHATRDLVKSTTNIRRMLRPDGFVALVEFTRNIFWFDLVFGLLEGWWLYEDARKHVLADEWFWDSSMREAGFKHVTWTDGTSDEARTLRIIAGFPAEPESDLFKPKKGLRKPKVETLVYRQVGRTSLSADIYLPSESSQAEKRPVGTVPPNNPTSKHSD